MAYTRGSRDDYDRWASVVNDESLSWDQIFPYILKVYFLTQSLRSRTLTLEMCLD